MLEDITVETVRRFLEHLERERKNGAHTRNSRLWRHIAQCESIVSVPFKGKTARVPEDLERG